MRQTISIIVKGKVQGVYYRQGTREKAGSLGITGYVQNMPDHSVYICATGTRVQLDALVSWCRVGPSRAIVTEVVTAEEPFQSFDMFIIQR